MNGGVQPTTAAEINQQQIAASQINSYFKTQLPALGYAIKSSAANEGGYEQRAAGAAAGSSREATAAALRQAGASSGIGTLPGSGNYSSKVSSILTGGAANTAVNSSGAQIGQKSNYIGQQQNIIGAGNAMVAQANQGLETAGGISQGIANAQTQASAANKQEVSGLATAALLAAA